MKFDPIKMTESGYTAADDAITVDGYKFGSGQATGRSVVPINENGEEVTTAVVVNGSVVGSGGKGDAKLNTVTADGEDAPESIYINGVLPTAATKVLQRYGLPLSGWTRSPDNPVLPKAASGSWDEKGTEEARAVWYDADGEYKVLYRGTNSNDVMAVGLARTSDLTTGPYPKASANPVFQASDSAFATSGIRLPELLNDMADANEVKMYYSGWSGTAFEGVGLATTGGDFTAWSDQGKVLAAADVNYSVSVVGQVGVDKLGGTYVMVFWAEDGSGNQSLGLAYSSDGTAWTMDANNPIISPSDVPNSNAGSLGAPHLFTVNSRLKTDRVFLSFEAQDPSGTWMTYIATTTQGDLTDGSDSSSWTVYPFNPVFLPSNTSNAWEDSGNVAEGNTHMFNDDGVAKVFSFYEAWPSSGSETTSETGVGYSSLTKNAEGTLRLESTLDWLAATRDAAYLRSAEGSVQLGSMTDTFEDEVFQNTWTVHHGSASESGGSMSITAVDSNEPQSAVTTDLFQPTDVTVRTKFKFASGATAGFYGPIVRYQRPSGAFYFAGVDVSNDKLAIYYNNGANSASFTSLKSTAVTVGAGTNYFLVFTASGTSFDAELQDSAGATLATVSATDSTLSAAGYVGHRSSEANTDTLQYEVEPSGGLGGDVTSKWYQSAHFSKEKLQSLDLASATVDVSDTAKATQEMRSAPDDGSGSPDTAQASAWETDPTNVPANEWVQTRVTTGSAVQVNQIELGV